MKKTMKTVTPPAPATKKSAKKTAAPAVKKTVAKKPPTIITVNANIGFGNTLYLRGDGPGLNWDKGVPLDCLSDDKWSLNIEHTKPFIFKVLLNDLVWCAGDDHAGLLTAGSSGLSASSCERNAAEVLLRSLRTSSGTHVLRKRTRENGLGR